MPVVEIQYVAVCHYKYIIMIVGLNNQDLRSKSMHVFQTNFQTQAQTSRNNLE